MTGTSLSPRRAMRTAVLAAALLAGASATLAQDPTIEVDPPLPTAGVPFTITVHYIASCFFGATIDVRGDQVEVTAGEFVQCLAPPHPVTFSVEAPGLDAGHYGLALYRILSPSLPVIPTPRELLAERDLEVQEGMSMIASVAIEQDAGAVTVRIAHFCPDPVLELVSLAQGVVRIRQRSIGLGAPCLFSDPPPFVTSFELGELDAGPYVLAVEGADDPERLVWVEPFTVDEPDRATLGLRDGRFLVSVAWQTADDQGPGFGRHLSDDSAAFWFFRAANTELLVKVLDGCQSTGHFWAFAAGLTNQGATLTVEDSLTGTTAVYESTLGSDFAPILDSRAFVCE